MIQWDCFFTQPTEKSAERGQATGEFLHLLQVLGLFHSLDCSYLLRIAFDSPLGNEKSQELPGWNTEHTLLWVELDLVGAQIGECLLEVVQECDSFDRFHYQVIYIHMQVTPELSVRVSLDGALIGSTSILQTKRHGDIEVSPKRGYKCSFYLIFHN